MAQELWEKAGVSVPVCVLVGLVTDPAGHEKTKEKILQWCVKQGFELVEWVISGASDGGTEEGDGDDSGDEGFLEAVGIDRVAEALQAHMWPVMDLKTDRKWSLYVCELAGDL